MDAADPLGERLGLRITQDRAWRMHRMVHMAEIAGLEADPLRDFARDAIRDIALLRAEVKRLIEEPSRRG